MKTKQLRKQAIEQLRTNIDLVRGCPANLFDDKLNTALDVLFRASQDPKQCSVALCCLPWFHRSILHGSTSDRASGSGILTLEDFVSLIPGQELTFEVISTVIRLAKAEGSNVSVVPPELLQSWYRDRSTDILSSISSYKASIVRAEQIESDTDSGLSLRSSYHDQILFFPARTSRWTQIPSRKRKTMSDAEHYQRVCRICCNGDDQGQMIFCHGFCNESFHRSCLDVSPTNGKATDRYCCPGCMQEVVQPMPAPQLRSRLVSTQRRPRSNMSKNPQSRIIPEEQEGVFSSSHWELATVFIKEGEITNYVLCQPAADQNQSSVSLKDAMIQLLPRIGSKTSHNVNWSRRICTVRPVSKREAPLRSDSGVWITEFASEVARQPVNGSWATLLGICGEVGVNSSRPAYAQRKIDCSALRRDYASRLAHLDRDPTQRTGHLDRVRSDQSVSQEQADTCRTSNNRSDQISTTSCVRRDNKFALIDPAENSSGVMTEQGNFENQIEINLGISTPAEASSILADDPGISYVSDIESDIDDCTVSDVGSDYNPAEASSIDIDDCTVSDVGSDYNPAKTLKKKPRGLAGCEMTALQQSVMCNSASELERSSIEHTEGSYKRSARPRFTHAPFTLPRRVFDRHQTQNVEESERLENDTSTKSKLVLEDFNPAIDFALPPLPTEISKIASNWQMDLQSYETGNHHDLDELDTTSINNILRFVHQRCEQIQVLGRLVRDDRAKIFHSTRSLICEYVIHHTHPERIGEFQWRVLASYSAKVKEFLGRNEWAWTDFIDLPQAQSSKAGTYWILSLQNSSYVGSASASTPAYEERVTGLRARELDHTKILAFSSEQILVAKSEKRNLGTRFPPMTCHIHLSREQENFESETAGRTRNPQNCWALRTLTEPFTTFSGANNLSYPDHMFLSVLESLDVLYTRSLQPGASIYQHPDCFLLQGDWPKSKVCPLNRALPWFQKGPNTGFSRLRPMHIDLLHQIRRELVSDFGKVDAHVRRAGYSLFLQHTSMKLPWWVFSKIWRLHFPDDSAAYGPTVPGLSSAVSHLICEKGPQYAYDHYQDFIASHGSQFENLEEKVYAGIVKQVAVTLYHHFVHPTPAGTRCKGDALRAIVERDWSNELDNVIERIKTDFGFWSGTIERSILTRQERKSKHMAFWGPAYSRFGAGANESLLHLLEKYHSSSPITTVEEANELMSKYPVFNNCSSDPASALLAYIQAADKNLKDDRGLWRRYQGRDQFYEEIDVLLQSQEKASVLNEADPNVPSLVESTGSLGIHTQSHHHEAAFWDDCSILPSDSDVDDTFSEDETSSNEGMVRTVNNSSTMVAHPRKYVPKSFDPDPHWQPREVRNPYKGPCSETQAKESWFVQYLYEEVPHLIPSNVKLRPEIRSILCPYAGLDHLTWGQVCNKARYMGLKKPTLDFTDEEKARLIHLLTFDFDKIPSGAVTSRRRTNSHWDTFSEYPGLEQRTWGMIVTQSRLMKLSIVRLINGKLTKRWVEEDEEIVRKLWTVDFDQIPRRLKDGPTRGARCTYPGLEGYTWARVGGRARRLGLKLTNPAQQTRNTTQPQKRKWTTELEDLLKELFTINAHLIPVGALSKSGQKARCTYPGLQQFSWLSVAAKARRLGWTRNFYPVFRTETATDANSEASGARRRGDGDSMILGTK